MRKFELSSEDFETLLLSLGIAAGACFRGNQQSLGLRVIALTIKIIAPEAPDTDPSASPSSPQDGAPPKAKS